MNKLKNRITSLILAFAMVISILPVSVVSSVASEPDSDFVIDDNGVLLQYTGTDSEIIIPKTATAIGDRAFYYATNLKKVAIPASIKTIGEGAFYACDSLSEISIPNSVIEIGEGAFFGCTNLTKARISDNITELKSYMFYKCENLLEIVIPDKVKKIEKEVFRHCVSLTKITIGKVVSEIGEYALDGCDALAQIGVNNLNPNFSSVGGVLFTKDKTILITYPPGKKDSVYKIPDTVKTITPSSFYNCQNLTMVTFGASVEEIGDWAFSYCNSLESLTFEGETPPKFGMVPFSNCNKLTNVYTPPGTINNYLTINALSGYNITDAEYCKNCDSRPCICCYICGKYPCICPCLTCGFEPCKCCKICWQYPCICCENCKMYPCICACEVCGKIDCICACEICGKNPCECAPCVVCGLDGCVIKHGCVLGGETVTIADALEILMYLADIPASIIHNDETAKKAAIISDPLVAEPTISDALQILMLLANMSASKLYPLYN